LAFLLIFFSTAIKFLSCLEVWEKAVVLVYSVKKKVTKFLFCLKLMIAVYLKFEKSTFSGPILPNVSTKSSLSSHRQCIIAVISINLKMFAHFFLSKKPRFFAIPPKSLINEFWPEH
jgi:hypothetical protein